MKIVVDADTTVTGLLVRPPRARALLLLAHGAGADMHHAFMAGLASALADVGVATLRYQFPYTEQGKKRPDPAPRCEATVRAACAAAPDDLPRLAGGKSMGGRMTTRAQAAQPLPGVQALVSYCFPLHPPGNPAKAGERAAHLAALRVPVLFVQGDRDAFAPARALAPHVAPLGARAHLAWIVGADHGFAVRKRAPAEVLAELAQHTRAFCDEVLG